MIKRLKDGAYYPNVILQEKINELIDAWNGKPARKLICPHCDSEEWESLFTKTLMGGPVNYYTYTCKKCNKATSVKRVQHTDPCVYLGPEDDAAQYILKNYQIERDYTKYR